MTHNPLIRKIVQTKTKPTNKSAGILDDFAIRKNIATKEGTIEKVPVDDSDIANKKYVDDQAGGTTHAILSATHTDSTASAVTRGSVIIGDSTPKWVELNVGINGQVLTTDGTDITWGSAGSGDVTAAQNLTDNTIVQGDGGAKGVKTSTATVGQIASNVTHSSSDGSDHSNVVSNTAASHAQSHTIVSHSDTTATGAELDALTGGADTTLHDHAGISENTTHRSSDGSDHSLVSSALQNIVEDTTPELGGEMDAGAHTIGFTQQAATGDGTTTIDWKLGNKFAFTFGAQNDTFTFTAPSNPCNILLKLIQDGTGSRTATWPSTVKWPSGTAPTLSTGAAAIDIIGFYFDGSDYFGVDSLNFS